MRRCQKPRIPKFEERSGLLAVLHLVTAESIVVRVADTNGAVHIAHSVNITRIEFIESIFADGEVSEVWITFADPQIGREKKRLTAPLFMNRYRNFLKPGGIIHLKTDSRYLHEYSLAMAQQNGLKILAAGTDIYGEDRERLYSSDLFSVSGRDAIDALFQVQTFYEAQYLAQGFPITYLAFLADHEGAYVSPEWAEDLWKDEGHHFVIPSGLPVASKFYPEGK